MTEIDERWDAANKRGKCLGLKITEEGKGSFSWVIRDKNGNQIFERDKFDAIESILDQLVKKFVYCPHCGKLIKELEFTSSTKGPSGIFSVDLSLKIKEHGEDIKILFKCPECHGFITDDIPSAKNFLEGHLFDNIPPIKPQPNFMAGIIEINGEYEYASNIFIYAKDIEQAKSKLHDYISNTYYYAGHWDGDVRYSPDDCVAVKVDWIGEITDPAEAAMKHIEIIQ